MASKECYTWKKIDIFKKLCSKEQLRHNQYTNSSQLNHCSIKTSKRVIGIVNVASDQGLHCLQIV